MIPYFGGKLIFFTFKSAARYIFLYMKDDSLIKQQNATKVNPSPFNSGVTWPLFKYFSLLATFTAKLIHFHMYFTLQFFTAFTPNPGRKNAHFREINLSAMNLLFPLTKY